METSALMFPPTNRGAIGRRITVANPQIVDQIVQAIVARLLPHLQSGGNGNGSGTKPPLRKLLTIKEASIYLSRSESALYHLVARREIAVVRHGRNLRFDVKELDRWIEGDRV